MKKYDFIVIGGGIVGCSISRWLSMYNADLLLIEKGDDVASGCSRANSGIVHAGYDALPNTHKARFNVRGNEIYHTLAQELYVPFENNGSLVLGGKDDYDKLVKLYDRGIENGVKQMQILDKHQLLQMLPNVSDGIEWALFAKCAGIVSPYEMTIALAEQAVINGAEIVLENTVKSVCDKGDCYEVTTDKGKYCCHILINASGYDADRINGTANKCRMDLLYTKGEYFILDSAERKNFKYTCFPLPNEKGKGVLVAPTADGNVIVGPTSVRVNDGTNTAVTKEGLDYIKQSVSSMLNNVSFRSAIRVFAGVRVACGEDFVIKREGNYITVGGICSPGLTAAPAIAEYVVEELIKQTGTTLQRKSTFLPRPRPIITRSLCQGDWEELIKKDKAYSRMVCRCERITEGEVRDALNGPLPVRSLDALKRRVRIGMGRCQGGFCTSRVMEIISRELNIPFDKITKKGGGSEIVVNTIKENLK